jgi:hypothetical protein
MDEEFGTKAGKDVRKLIETIFCLKNKAATYASDSVFLDAVLRKNRGRIEALHMGPVLRLR